MPSSLDTLLAQVKSKNIYEPEFVQAVAEFLESVVPFIKENTKYKDSNLLNRILAFQQIH